MKRKYVNPVLVLNILLKEDILTSSFSEVDSDDLFEDEDEQE